MQTQPLKKMKDADMSADTDKSLTFNSENMTEFFPLLIKLLKIHDMTSYGKM